MNLLDLPEEILIIIIKNLDTISLYNLYTACKHVRNLISMYGIIKLCNLSLSVLATAETLKLNFFKDIAGTLQELNICGVPGVNKSNLLPVAKRLKTLKTLNVAFTKIDVLDFLEIYNVCPTVKNICINLTINCVKADLYKLQLQETFRNFLNVHFVGSYDLLYTQIACRILEKANLKSLQFTVTQYDYSTTSDYDVDVMSPPFESFCVYILSQIQLFPTPHAYSTYLLNAGGILKTQFFAMLTLHNYEILIVGTDSCSDHSELMLYSTPIFESFLNEHFNLNPELIKETSFSYIDLKLCLYVRFWKKDSTTFDSNFFSNLCYNLKRLLPFHFTKTPVPSKFDWYSTCPSPDVTKDTDSIVLSFKKQRIASPNYELNYDHAFPDKSDIKLIIMFKGDITNAVTLSPNSTYLKKLTYLSLSGVKVRYSTEFFNILFRCCENLVTLNVDVHAVSSFCSALCRSLPLSGSIKNLRVVDRRIDFNMLFSSMSQCRTLENVHIVETAKDSFSVSDPSLMFEKCVNLYCLYVYILNNESALRKQIQAFKKAKETCSKKHLNAKIFKTFDFDPYCDVFNICRIKSNINV